MTDSISPRVREVPPHCATCGHYVTDPAVLQTGECRLHPATLTGSPEAGNLALRHPTVAATDYCGAHPDTASLIG